MRGAAMTSRSDTELQAQCAKLIQRNTKLNHQVTELLAQCEQLELENQRIRLNSPRLKGQVKNG